MIKTLSLLLCSASILYTAPEIITENQESETVENVQYEESAPQNEYNPEEPYATVKIIAEVQDELKGSDIYVSFSNDTCDITCKLYESDEYQNYQNLNLGEYSIYGGIYGDIRNEYSSLTDAPVLILSEGQTGITIHIYIGDREWLNKQEKKLQEAETFKIEEMTEEEAKIIGVEDEWKEIHSSADSTADKEDVSIEYKTAEKETKINTNIKQIIGCVIFALVAIGMIIHSVKKRE